MYAAVCMLLKQQRVYLRESHVVPSGILMVSYSRSRVRGQRELGKQWDAKKVPLLPEHVPRYHHLHPPLLHLIPPALH